MNILFALSQLEVTGAEVFAVTLANKLVEKGHSVFIISDTLTKKTNALYLPLPISKRKMHNRVKNIIDIRKLIKEKGIDIVVANSRAAAWVSSIACKLSRIPLISVIHGRQSTFLSRRLFHGYGYYTLAVCEKLQDQLLGFFKIPEYKIEILRNPFDLTLIKSVPKEKKEKTITLLGRLSGPKGELALKILEFYSANFKSNEIVKFRVVGGQKVPPEFRKFEDKFEFTGFIENIGQIINESDVVIGSGRIAIESILRKKPTIAIGEACSIGLIDENNIDFALKTNFGDMNESERQFDFKLIIKDIERALSINECNGSVVDIVKNEFDLEKITSRLESVFQSVLVRYHKKEIPIIYYHRVIKDSSEAGNHGIYVTQKQFDEHLRYLKSKNYKTVTFDEALKLKKENRIDKNVIITFDDGYEDNYLYAFPILKKYNFNAEIFLVAGLAQNDWDRKDNEPVARMLNTDQIKEMKKYGIRFGSHTLAHKDLMKCGAEDKEAEIAGSKKTLEDKLGFEIESFAYPYGNYDNSIITLIQQAGYKYGYATDNGPLGLHENNYQIRRITIFPNTTNFHLARKVKGNYIFKKFKKEKDILNFNNQNKRLN
jgi:peptidoglycan/xylan/chitin deacetylase (PgdA/CDA1 family)